MLIYLLFASLVALPHSIKSENGIHKYSGPTYESLQNFTWHLKDVFNMHSIDAFYPSYIDLDKEVDLYIYIQGQPLQWYGLTLG
jgi:hypothetical protein